MSTLASVAFSGIFLAIGVAAVIGHVVLIDVLLRPAAIQATPMLSLDAGQVTRIR